MDTNKRLTMAVDAEEMETEEMQKKRRLRSPSSSISDEDLDLPPSSSPISDEDLDLPYEKLRIFDYSPFVKELRDKLPCCWLLWSKDWSSMLQYIGSCDSSSSIDSALHFELVSLCQWFLSTQAPESFKKGANQLLERISSGTSLDTQMSIDHQPLYYKLDHVLDSKNEGLIQQACCAIAFLCWCCGCNYFKDLSFGDGVVNKLFNLVDQDSPHLAHARRAICSIACIDKRVKKKIIMKAKHDKHFKWPFEYGDRDSKEAEHACMSVASIVGGKKDDAIWDKIVGCLIPHIVNVNRMSPDIPVLVASAYAISSATDGATHEQIDKLFGMGCLRVLCYNLNVESAAVATHILDGIENILKAGHEQGDNKYVEWIVEDDVSRGWAAFADVGFDLPCVPYDIKTSIKMRGYEIAYRFGNVIWYLELLGDSDSDSD